MEFLDSIKERIASSDDKELYTYFGIFGGILLLLFGFLAYYHHRRVSWYTTEVKKLDKLRSHTRKILRDATIVKAQQQLVEEILAQDKDFLIGQAYQSIIRKQNLASKLIDQSAPTTGESVSGKTEVQITSNLRNMSMKEFTYFLIAIAQAPKLYTIEITIKNTSGRPTDNLEIMVATLDPSAL